MDGAWSPSRFVRTLGDWAPGDAAIFRSLANRLDMQIRSGRIPAGVRLPSEREFARALGVSRSTVVAALDELRTSGLIASRQGAGTYVTSAGARRGPRDEYRLAGIGLTLSEDTIDLRSAALPGLPFVAQVISDLSRPILDRLVESHGYAPEGLLQLRTAVARYYADLGLPTSEDQILVTSGAQQALRLLAATLVERGSAVIVEEPTFRGGIETLRAVGADLVTVPSGPAGIDLATLDAVLRTRRVAMVFVVSSAHNPTGTVLDLAGKRRLVEICAHHRTLLVEDAAAIDALIDDTPNTPASGNGEVVTIGSASKSFWGGLRVGWLRADPRLVTQLALAKGSEDLGTSLIAQAVTVDLLARIEEARLARRTMLAASRAAVLDLVQREVPEWNPMVPHAGASLWVRLPAPVAVGFTQYAARNGVRVLPGPTFSAHDGLDDYLRIAYARQPTVVKAGVSELVRLWHDFR